MSISFVFGQLADIFGQEFVLVNGNKTMVFVKGQLANRVGLVAYFRLLFVAWIIRDLTENMSFSFLFF